MLETSHALVAGAIVAHTKNPTTAIVLSFLSHYIMDAIPHWDFGTDWRERRKLVTGLFAIGDVIVGFIAGYLFFGHLVPLPLLFLAIAVSMLPDWIETPWYIFYANHRKKTPGKNAGFLENLAYGIYKAENSFHRKTNFTFGMITQIVTVGFFLFLLK